MVIEREPKIAMRIAVMGAGSVGGYLGGRLAQAGNAVAMIARGEHLRAIQHDGLRVKSHWGDFCVQVEATDDPKSIGPVDLVLHTVKTYQNAAALPGLVPLLGPNTRVMPLQNGVDSYEAVAGAVGVERVLPGAVYVEVSVGSPGVIVQRGGVMRVVFGEISGPPTDRCQTLQETLSVAGISTEVSPDIAKELWSKYIFICVLAGVTSAVRAPLRVVLSYPDLKETVVQALREVEAVGRAKGVALDQDIVPHTVKYMEEWAQDLQASMYTDLELGRPLELDALTGAVVRLGAEVGVPTPINGFLYSLLQVHRNGSPQPQ